mgnify:FL=1
MEFPINAKRLMTPTVSVDMVGVFLFLPPEQGYPFSSHAHCIHAKNRENHHGIGIHNSNDMAGIGAACHCLASHLRISVALLEICVGIAADYWFGDGALGGDLPWLRFIAGTGAVLLTFLAGAELQPAVLRRKWKEVSVVGFIGFLSPFLGCAAVAHYILGWEPRASLLAGVALSTTSMAVVYPVMLETGFNRTDFGKGILGACFVNDLGTVLALGILFAPFTYKTIVFAAACIITLTTLPFITSRLVNRYAFHTAAVRTKWVLFVLYGLGALAL